MWRWFVPLICRTHELVEEVEPVLVGVRGRRGAYCDGAIVHVYCFPGVLAIVGNELEIGAASCADVICVQGAFGHGASKLEIRGVSVLAAAN